MSSDGHPPHTSHDQQLIEKMRKTMERFEHDQKRRVGKQRMTQFWKLQRQPQDQTQKSAQNLREEEEATRRAAAAEEEAIRIAADMRRQTEEEARRRAVEEETRRRAEEEARRLAEQVERAEEEARRAEEEIGRRAEEARRWAEEEEKTRRRAEEEARRRAEEEGFRRQAETEDAERQRREERAKARYQRQEQEDSGRRRKEPAVNREITSQGSHDDQIERYERLWRKLVDSKNRQGSPSTLTFLQVPWPLFDPKPKDISDWTPELVEQFILHSPRLQSVGSKKILCTELLRWHPDKFQNIVSAIPDDVEKVKAGSLFVIKVLTDLNTRR